MWVWNFVLWLYDDRLGSFYPTCNDAANFFADIYRYLGYFFLGVLAIGLFALLCSRLRPKDDIRGDLGGQQNTNFMAGQSGATYGNASANPYNKSGAEMFGDKNRKVA